MRALVLSGGGGRGAYEYGVYKALDAAGWRFDVLAGTSVGAITAAGIASGLSIAQLDALWARMHTFRVIRPRLDVWRFPKWTHLFSTKPLLSFLEEHIDYDALRRSPIQLRVMASDLNSGHLRVFTNADLTPRRLLASASIPLLFPSVEDDTGDHYWDGGPVANTPVRPALQAGATDVTAVLLSPLGGRPLRPPRHLWEAIGRTTDLVMLGNLKQDIRDAQEDARREGRAPPRFHIISPSDGLGITAFFNFSGRKARELIAWGEQDARAYVDGLQGDRVEAQAAREVDEARARELRE